jgi:hypothetical protein
MALTEFVGLVPLGNLNPPGHTFPTDHLYFYLNHDTGGAPVPGTVVSPGAVTLWGVDSSENLTSGHTDYSLRFSPCDEVDFYFGHVATIAPALASRIGDLEGADCDEYSTGGSDYRLCHKTVDLELASGEEIGSAGAPGQNALDLGAIDRRSPPLAYANDARDSEYLLHAVCPVDLYASPARESLEARFSNYDGTVARTEPPLCGEIEQDEPGTAQGRWYVVGTTDPFPEDPHLALVHDNVLPALPRFSVGTSLPGLAGVWTFAVNTSGAGSVNRDFDEVTPGSTWCWEPAYLFGGPIPNTVVVAAMPDASTLSIETQTAASCGAGPWTLGAGAVDFER